MLKRIARKKGFTLVEVIVVLVILAILAAIMIPAMTGWIDKSRKGQAVMEARQCLIAAEGIAVQLYGEGKAYDLSANKAETLKLAEVPAGGDIQALTMDARANPIKMIYQASNKLIVVYENGAFSVSKSGGVQFSDSASLKQIYPVMQTTIGNTNSQYFYSGTAGVSQVNAALKAAGIDLDASAAKWSIRYSGQNSYPKLYWTNDNLSGHKAGDVIPVMTYTLSTGRYNVWNVKLENKDGVLSLGTEMSHVTTVEGDAQTYDQMIADYKKATGQP